MPPTQMGEYGGAHHVLAPVQCPARPRHSGHRAYDTSDTTRHRVTGTRVRLQRNRRQRSPSQARPESGREPRRPGHSRLGQRARELVEFQNRKKPVAPYHICDITVGYVGFEVKNLDTLLEKAKTAGPPPTSR